MGIRPYAADCGALVLPLASKVKLRTPSNGSEQFLTIAVCSLCCRLTAYNFQRIRLRSLDRLGMTSMGALPCHPERNEVKSKDLYSNLDNILTELPRKARDGRGRTHAFPCATPQA